MSRFVFGVSLSVMMGCYASTACADYCPDYVLYVCGIKNGQQKTYINSYVATNDGAMQLTDGKCKLRWPELKHPHPAGNN